MKEILKIDSISNLHQLLEFPKPKHPLISVIKLCEIKNAPHISEAKMVSSYYSVYLKIGCSVLLKYGRSYYDFEDGTVVTTAPEQVLSIERDEENDKSQESNLEGWALHFHPDLIKQYPLAKKINQYGFFSYEVNEALHLSDKERATISSVIDKITDEYEANIDEFSQDVLVTNVELLLSYIQRFYKRQFLTRKTVNSDLLSSFEILVKDYFNSEELETIGLPKVSYFANRLNLSPS